MQRERKLGVLLEGKPVQEGPTTGETVVAKTAEVMGASANAVARKGAALARWVRTRVRA